MVAILLSNTIMSYFLDSRIVWQNQQYCPIHHFHLHSRRINFMTSTSWPVKTNENWTSVSSQRVTSKRTIISWLYKFWNTDHYNDRFCIRDWISCERAMCISLIKTWWMKFTSFVFYLLLVCRDSVTKIVL